MNLFSLQLHPWPLAALQQDLRRREPATERQVPGAAVLLPDCGRPARRRVRGGEARDEAALLPHPVLGCVGPGKWRQDGGRGRSGGGGGERDTWKRGAAWLGVRRVYWVFGELWGRYVSLLVIFYLSISTCYHFLNCMVKGNIINFSSIRS